MYYSTYKMPVYTAYIISCNIYIIYINIYKLYKYLVSSFNLYSIKGCQILPSKLLLGYKCRFSLLCDWRHIVHLVPHPNALPCWVQLFLLKNVLKVVQSCKVPTWLFFFRHETSAQIRVDHHPISIHYYPLGFLHNTNMLKPLASNHHWRVEGSQGIHTALHRPGRLSRSREMDKMVFHGMPRGIHKWHAKESMKTLWKTTHKFQKKCVIFIFLMGHVFSSGPNLQALENHSNLHTVALEIHEQTMDRFVPINLSMLKAPKKTVLHGHSDLCRLWATAKVMEELGSIRICGWLAGSNAMALQQSSTFLLDPSRAHAPHGPTDPTVQPHRVTSIAARFDEATPAASMNRLAALGRETRWSWALEPQYTLVT